MDIRTFSGTFFTRICCVPTVRASAGLPFYPPAGDLRKRPGEADGAARGDLREEGEGDSRHRGKVCRNTSHASDRSDGSFPVDDADIRRQIYSPSLYDLYDFV